MWRWWSEGGREERVLEAVLRVGVAGCFIGHGAFGILQKAAWLPYFAVVGIPEAWAWTLMPVVGAIDITVGILALVSPRPAVLAWAAVWAMSTALLRPLAGESVFEVLERAGNYGIPLALLVAAGFRSRDAGLRDWLGPIRIGRLGAAQRRTLQLALRTTLALLLVGHGALAASGKPLLIEHMAVLGGGAGLLRALGWGEIALGVTIAAHPGTGLLWTAFAWKVGSEMLYPVSGAPVWEFVERAGSYAAPLALLVLAPVPVRRLQAGRAAAGSAGSGARAAVVVAVAVAALVASTAVVTAAGSGGGNASHGTLAYANVGAGPAGQDATGTPLRAETSLLDRLRGGELILACRHAITDRSRGDSRPVDHDDRSTQRVLSEAGEAQARELGRTLRGLGAPIGEVLASPYFRTMDSGRLGFGRVEATEVLVYGDRPDQRAGRRRLLSEPPTGGNRVLMTHQGILYGLFPAIERGSIREGDCVVVLPEGNGEHEVLARMGPTDFAALDRVTLVCRHAITGSFREVEPVDYDDPSTQRLLSTEGERQAAAMGRGMRALGVEVGELVASPMHRARRTAELMFPETPLATDDIWHTNGGSYGGPPRDRRAGVLATPVDRGVRLIVSHIGTMQSVLSDSLQIEEGDCVVVRPDRDTFHELGVVTWRTWLPAPGREPSQNSNR